MTIMGDTERDRAKALFLEAAGLAPAERARYLDSHCGDEQLRARVERLLEHEARGMGGFLEKPAPSPDSTAWAAPAHGAAEHPETIGRYRVLRVLGEGGMGVVYLAEQEEPVRRRVAVKLIKLGMDTKEVIRRFESERQALALMEHSSIARVYDAGVGEGRPYFAMEYVDGVAITTYSETHGLTTQERLQLFVRVCDAVQHAHQKGIIHRDIKPSNILVTREDGTPLPKIIDFGVAKATAQRLTAETFATAAGQTLGTPAYMSPEQADLGSDDIDTRSDIYSLGVLLYELLVGALPLDFDELYRAGYSAVQRAIQEAETPRPSTRLGALGEISPRVAKNQRSEVASLVRELRGDLDWITLKALEKDRTRRYSTASELAADIRRYLEFEPVLASPPSVAYRLTKFVRRNRGPVALGLAATIILLLAVAAGWFALAAERTSRTLLEASYEPRVTAAVREMQLGQLSAREARGRTGVLHPFRMRAEALLRDADVSSAVSAIRELDELIELLPDRVDAYWYRTRAHQLLGDVAKAREDLLRTLEIDPDFLPGIVALAELLDDAAAREEAGAREEAAAWRERIEDLGKEGWARHWLSARDALFHQRWSQAAEAYARAIESDRAKEPYAGWTLQTRLERATALLEAGDPILAYRESVVVRDRWPGSIEAGLLEGRALSMFATDGRERAERVFEALYDAAEHKTVVALGVASLFVGDVESALEWIERISDEAIRLRFRSTGLFFLGRSKEALAAGRRSVSLEPANAESHVWLAGSLMSFARRENPRLLPEAIELLEKAAKLEPGVGRTHAWLAVAYARKEDRKRALENAREALRLGPSGEEEAFHGIVADSYARLSRLESARGSHERAEELEERARELHERAVEFAPRNPNTHNNRGLFLFHADKNPEEAIPCFDEAIAIDETFAWPHWNKAKALVSLAEEEKDKDPELRARLRSRAMASLRKATRGIPRQPRPYLELAQLLREEGDTRGAFQAYAGVLELRVDHQGAHKGLQEMLSAGSTEFREEATALRVRLTEAVKSGLDQDHVLRTLEMLSRGSTR